MEMTESYISPTSSRRLRFGRRCHNHRRWNVGKSERSVIGQPTGCYWLLKITPIRDFTPTPSTPSPPSPLSPPPSATPRSHAVVGGDGDDVVNVTLKKICLYDSVHAAVNETHTQMEKPEYPNRVATTE